MANPVSKRVKLANKRGLHARASAAFVKTAQEFDAVVTVTSHSRCEEETVDADSIMELLMLGSACGDDITITVNGPQAIAALSALTQLVEGRFGEGE